MALITWLSLTSSAHDANVKELSAVSSAKPFAALSLVKGERFVPSEEKPEYEEESF